MESSLKMFFFVDVHERERSWEDITVKTCEEDALLYFVTNHKYAMMDYCRVAWNILYYAYRHREDAPEISFDSSNFTRHDYYNYERNLTKEDKIVLANWVLLQWSMDPNNFDLENLFDDRTDNIGVIYTPFYEQFKNLPREKQIELGRFSIEGDYYIECASIGSINGMEKIIQQAVKPYKDEIKKMRLEALKAVRPDVPGEIVDMCIGKYL